MHLGESHCTEDEVVALISAQTWGHFVCHSREIHNRACHWKGRSRKEIVPSHRGMDNKTKYLYQRRPFQPSIKGRAFYVLPESCLHCQDQLLARYCLPESSGESWTKDPLEFLPTRGRFYYYGKSQFNSDYVDNSF